MALGKSRSQLLSYLRTWLVIEALSPDREAWRESKINAAAGQCLPLRGLRLESGGRSPSEGTATEQRHPYRR